MTFFQLVQWRAAIRLEKAGMKHSSGRSVRKFAAGQLGLPLNSSHDVVMQAIARILQQEIKNRVKEMS